MERSDIETNYISDTLIIFKTTCSCQHNSMTIVVDKFDEKDEHPTCEITYDTYWSDESGLSFDDPWYYRLWFKLKRRIKGILSILFKGNIECSDGFIFKDKEHIDAFIKALNDAIEAINKK